MKDNEGNEHSTAWWVGYITTKIILLVVVLYVVIHFINKIW
jgi:hypothetical protein